MGWSGLDSRPSGLASSSTQHHCVVYLGKTSTEVHGSLFTHSHKCAQASLTLGDPCNGLVSHLGREGGGGVGVGVGLKYF